MGCAKGNEMDVYVVWRFFFSSSSSSSSYIKVLIKK